MCDLSQSHALHRAHPVALILTIVCPVEKYLLLGKEETRHFPGATYAHGLSSHVVVARNKYVTWLFCLLCCPLAWP